jgi:IclR family transcriptional regulator, acetate operon repressor
MARKKKIVAEPEAGKKGQRNEMRMIARAAAVLRAIADQPGGLSLGQLAKETGLARSTIQRLVGALEAERFVATEAATIGVRLGSEVPRIANSAHRDVKLLLRPHIEKLHSEIQDTVDVTLLQAKAAVVIDQVAAFEHALRVVSQMGSALPLHCTSNGKAHLAQIEEAEILKVLPLPLIRFTANTISDTDQLFKQIAQIRKGAFAEDNEEYADGVCAVSVPIRGLRGGNYVIGVSMPRSRFAEKRRAAQSALVACRNSIETALGFPQ